MTYFESLGQYLTGKLNTIIDKVNLKLQHIEFYDAGGTKVDEKTNASHILKFTERNGVKILQLPTTEEIYVDISAAIQGMASNSYVDQKITDLIGGAPGQLDTLKELSDALAADANYAATITAQMATKADAATVTAQLADKADVTALNSGLALKVDASALGTTTEFTNYMDANLTVLN